MSSRIVALLLLTSATASDASWTTSCILSNATCVEDTEPALRLRAICKAFLYESHMVSGGCKQNGFTCKAPMPKDGGWMMKGMKKYDRVDKDGKCKPEPPKDGSNDAFSDSKVCPGSTAWVHASCQVTVNFPNTQCAIVQEEVEARIEAQNGWKDPHNHGSYSNRLPPTSSLIQGKRITGDSHHYEDHFNLAFEQSGADCKLSGCSESQVTSILDFSTNYCNMHDLYCGSQDNCPVVKSDLKGYIETFGSCRQHDSTNCIKPPPSEEILV
eukprot:gnl/MRDRNA2_/MRDRNA2_28470_c0_seq1.p1 gnl/MRDRNA2_/MRDRNA2_28470_c0~~gnl/MRDRNA2_/MRDRNA2_28470_c0_seq1.p1  ORF type:complete len:270 (+),score=48.59 gnl/MRDRNA2_/MRDRNA2_28470_c0_seq1:90-899(+)